MRVPRHPGSAGPGEPGTLFLKGIPGGVSDSLVLQDR